MHLAPPIGARADRALPFVAGAAALGFYLLSRTPNLALAHDAAGYLAVIVEGTGADLAHPHHLLYHPVAKLWLVLLRSVGLGGDPALAVASLNSVAGAVCVGLVVALLRHRGGASRALAAAGAASAAVSFGLWFYSACVEVYIIPLAFLLGALYVALGPLTWRRAVAVGILHGLAMVFHQVHVLFGVVVLAVWWREGGARSNLRWVGGYIAAGTVVVALAYGTALAVAVRPASVEEAWTWFTLYAQDSEGYVSGLSVGTFAKAMVGFTRSVVGSHFAFAMPVVQGLIERVFPDKILTDETFLVAGLPGWVPPVLVGLSVVATLLGLGLVVRAARSPKLPASGLRTGLWAWVGVYAAFFLFWDPFNVEFWIPQTTALWMLLALRLVQTESSAPRRFPSWGVLAGMAVLLAVINGVGTIGPASDPDNDAFAYQLKPLDGRLREGDLLVVDRAHIIEYYAALRFGVETVGLAEAVREGGPKAGAASVDAAVRQVRGSGRTVALARDVFDPKPTTVAVVGPGVIEAAQSLRGRLGAFEGAWAGNELATYRIVGPSDRRDRP